MSTPIKAIIGIIAIAIIGLGAGWIFRSLKGGSSTTSNLNVYDTSDFAWGVTLLTFPFPVYNEGFTATQTTEAEKLGINYVRIDYVPSNPKAAEVAVDDAIKNGLKTVLVIPFGPKDIFTDKNLESSATTYVTDIVNKFKGKVGVYQLATEVASVALANNGAVHGIELKDYPPARLDAVTTWVKAATTAVKKADPSAKRLINDQWVHVGFFENYFAKGGDFDILGWNWFSDMGTSMDSVVLNAAENQNFALMEKLKSYNKPIWLTEVNRRMGSQNKGEQAQAEFITTMGNYVKTQDAIKGFFVFNFLEDQAAPAAEKGYGIITAVDNGGQKITGHKPAFDAYKKVIQEAR
jgi:hypothetical protein